MYGHWLSVPGLLQTVADGLRFRNLIFAVAWLAACGLIVWRRYRKRRRKPASEPDPLSRIRPEAKAAVDPRLLVHRDSRALAERARAKGLHFRSVVAANVPQRICADASRIRLVLLHLLNNAVKFTEEGAVRLEVTWAAGARQLRFHVYDTGAGIDSETLTRLLAADGMSGGGLVISRRVVELMGGTMGAESEPRGGSTFWFSVPVEVLEAARAARPRHVWKREAIEAASPRPLLPKSSSPGKRVLIVEPDPVSQVAALWGVRSLGYLAEVVSSGPAAYDAWQRGPFDLLLLDCAMPEASETIRRIRGLETGCVPIIAMNDIRGEAISIDDHLAKPLCLIVLARTLDHWLGDGAVAASEASSDRLSVPV